MSRLLCKFFGHKRNIHGVRRTGAAWRSACVHCHQPLIRISRGAWQLSAEADRKAIDEQDQLPLFDDRKGQPTAMDR